MSSIPDRPARPWDLFNKKIERVAGKVAAERFEICMACPELIKTTHQCKKCGCIMNLKVKLPHSSCPLHKWEAVDVETELNKYTEEELGL